MGILKRIRSTPLPGPTYLLAVLASTLIVFTLQAIALFVLGKVLRDTPFPSHLVSILLLLALGAACFAALGLAITGLIRSLEGSSAIVNVIILPMAFLCGSFGPTRHYPRALRAIARRAAAEVPRRLDERDLPARAPDLGPAGIGRGPGRVGRRRPARRGAEVPLGAARGLARRPKRAIRLSMQVEQAIVFPTTTEPAGLELRVNFGVFAGRDATAAELEELAKLLVPQVGEVSLVAEQRHEIADGTEVLLHQVRIEVPADRLPDDRGDRSELEDKLVATAEFWTRACVADRHAEVTEL